MKRDESVTIAKAIGIILMVVGHSGLGGYPIRFIYLFHMPLFFFLSGYCFKESYLERPKEFLFRRLKGAYWPYVKWSLLFLLFHNFFAYFHIYGYSLSLKVTLVKALHITTGLWDSEQLLGGFWFLKSLFWGSLLFYAVKWCFRFRHGFVFGGGSLLMMSIICNATHFHVPYCGICDTDFAAAWFMLVGCEYHRKNIHIYKKVLMLGFFVLLLGTFLWPQQMINMRWETMIPYLFTGVIGSVLTFSVSKTMKNFCKELLVFIGNNTLDILIWHFLSFKIVSLIVAKINNLPIEAISEFPVLKEYSASGWWIAYAIVGLFIPVVFSYSMNHFRKRVFN